MDVQITNPDHAKILDALMAFQEKPAPAVLEDLIEMSQMFLAPMADPLGKGPEMFLKFQEQSRGDQAMASYTRFFLDAWNAGEHPLEDTDGS